MKPEDFNNISMNGRMAYLILCTEKYLLSVYPDQDWSELSNLMWAVTSEYWDEWDFKFMEIIPDYLFEKDSYESSGFEAISKEEYDYYSILLKNVSADVNTLLLLMHKLQEVYAYTTIPDNGEEASLLVIDACKILESKNIALPDVSIFSFTSFSERDGWGEKFDGAKYSLVSH